MEGSHHDYHHHDHISHHPTRDRYTHGAPSLSTCPKKEIDLTRKPKKVYQNIITQVKSKRGNNSTLAQCPHLNVNAKLQFDQSFLKIKTVKFTKINKM